MTTPKKTTRKNLAGDLDSVFIKPEKKQIGRPVKTDKEDLKVVTYKLRADLVQKIKALVNTEPGITERAVVETALIDYFAFYEKKFGRLKLDFKENILPKRST